MTRRRSHAAAAGLLATALFGFAGAAPAQTGPTIVQPGAPGEVGREVEAAAAATASRRPHTEADVRFMQDMIVHHLQAVEMTELVAERTDSPEIRLLARRIQLSQDDELRLMRRWLTDRGVDLPHEHAHHGAGPAHHAHMPGMISQEEMTGLAAARGDAFDALFLEYMIRHHMGALEMVADLFAADGSAQEAEIAQFAAHVEADQRSEIERMSRMLAAR